MEQNDDINQSRKLGIRGEELSVNYLQGKGYKILNRNWHYGHKELDIVAKDKSMLVIVEVKTRTHGYWEEPRDAVKRKKQKYIVEAADAYVQKYKIEAEVRFDIISVIWNNDKYTIEHIEDAFYPTLQ
ncbi:MAG: YraN family protein [Bacteroidales bacterium]